MQTNINTHATVSLWSQEPDESTDRGAEHMSGTDTAQLQLARPAVQVCVNVSVCVLFVYVYVYCYCMHRHTNVHFLKA